MRRSVERLTHSADVASRRDTVLVVNDSLEQLALMRTVLEDAGYDVYTASDGYEGVTFARSIRPDAILSDVVMPRVDGFELCRLVRATPELVSTPLLLISSLATDTGSAVAGIQAGADDYLESPFDPMRLVSRVARLIERERAEQILRRQLDFTTAVTASLAEGVVAFDGQRRVTFMNPAAEAVLGWTSEELDHGIEDLLSIASSSPETEARLDRSLTAALRFGASVRVEDGRFRRKDATTVPVSYGCSPIRIAGEIGGGVLTFHDVTERAEAEQQLRAKEVELREAQRLARVGSWTWSINPDVTAWSDEVFRITGRIPELGAPGYAVQRAEMYGEGLENLHRSVEHTLATGDPYEVEVEIIRPDGERRWTVTRGEAVRGPAGQIVVLRGTVQDITERRLEHRRLQEREEQLRLMTNAIDDVFWMRSSRMDRLLFVSPAYERLWGRSLASVYEQPSSFLDAVHPEDRERVRRVLAEHDHSAFTCEYRLLHPDGSVRWIRDRGYPVTSSDGEAVMMTGVASDITELHEKQGMLERANASLEMSERRYRDLVENLNDVVFSLRTDGIIQYVSPAARKYGYEPSALVDQHFSMVIHAEDLPAVERAMAQATIGAVQPFEFRALDREGRVQYARVSCRALLEDGRPAGITGVIMDVTEQRRAEEQLRASQRLEAVGRLAGGIAHDFNNLLVAIIGYAEFALDGLKASDPLRSDLQEIVKAGDRAAALTRQLLAFSRKQVLKPQELDLNEVLRGMEAMLRRLIGEDIDFQTIYAAEPGWVLADPGQMEQVIMNLAVNARDAMPTGGTLVIRTIVENCPPEDQPSTGADTCVAIVVTDTGCGMDDTIRAQIFEPFFSTKPAGEGTGLGLATVHGIVAQSGGRIAVESAPGLGTSFRVAFPRLSSATPKPALRADSASLGVSHGTILVVEDEAAVREVARRSLTEAGFIALTASDASQALRLCESRDVRIDLLLTDVVMPSMSGPALWESVRRERPDIPVLYMSGYSGTAIAQHGILAEGTHLIEKPFNGATLVRRVRELLERCGAPVKAPQR
jgi:PAS domain S-box-containing protein